MAGSGNSLDGNVKIRRAESNERTLAGNHGRVGTDTANGNLRGVVEAETKAVLPGRVGEDRTGNEFVHDELAGDVLFVGTDKDITVSGKLVSRKGSENVSVLKINFTSRQSAENEGVVLDFKSANSLGFSNLAHDESAVGSNREVLNRSIALDRQVAGGNIESTELVAITNNSADNSTGAGGRELAVFTNLHPLERDRLVLLDSNEVARAVELEAGVNRKSVLTGSKFNLAEAAGEGCVNTRHRSVLELFEFNAGELCSIGGRDLAVLENIFNHISLDSDLVAEDDQAVPGRSNSILDSGNLIEASEFTGGVRERDRAVVDEMGVVGSSAFGNLETGSLRRQDERAVVFNREITGREAVSHRQRAANSCLTAVINLFEGVVAIDVGSGARIQCNLAGKGFACNLESTTVEVDRAFRELEDVILAISLGLGIKGIDVERGTLLEFQFSEYHEGGLAIKIDAGLERSAIFNGDLVESHLAVVRERAAGNGQGTILGLNIIDCAGVDGVGIRHNRAANHHRTAVRERVDRQLASFLGERAGLGRHGILFTLDCSSDREGLGGKVAGSLRESGSLISRTSSDRNAFRHSGVTLNIDSANIRSLGRISLCFNALRIFLRANGKGLHRKGAAFVHDEINGVISLNSAHGKLSLDGGLGIPLRHSGLTDGNGRGSELNSIITTIVDTNLSVDVIFGDAAFNDHLAFLNIEIANEAGHVSRGKRALAGLFDGAVIRNDGILDRQVAGERERSRSIAKVHEVALLFVLLNSSFFSVGAGLVAFINQRLAFGDGNGHVAAVDAQSTAPAAGLVVGKGRVGKRDVAGIKGVNRTTVGSGVAVKHNVVQGKIGSILNTNGAAVLLGTVANELAAGLRIGSSIAVQEQSTAMSVITDGLIPFEIDVLRDNLGVRCVDGTAEGACSIFTERGVRDRRFTSASKLKSTALLAGRVLGERGVGNGRLDLRAGNVDSTAMGLGRVAGERAVSDLDSILTIRPNVDGTAENGFIAGKGGLGNFEICTCRTNNAAGAVVLLIASVDFVKLVVFERDVVNLQRARGGGNNRTEMICAGNLAREIADAAVLERDDIVLAGSGQIKTAGGVHALVGNVLEDQLVTRSSNERARHIILRLRLRESGLQRRIRRLDFGISFSGHGGTRDAGNHRGDGSGHNRLRALALNRRCHFVHNHQSAARLVEHHLECRIHVYLFLLEKRMRRFSCENCAEISFDDLCSGGGINPNIRLSNNNQSDKDCCGTVILPEL